MTTTVINLKGRKAEFGPRLEHAPAELLYVGRAQTMGGWRLSAHPLHNPYSVKQHGTPEGAVSAYCRHLLQAPSLLSRVALLRGRVLACWCAPELCHAHVLAALAEASRGECGALLEVFAADPRKALLAEECGTQKARVVYVDPPAAREAEEPSEIRSTLERNRVAVEEWIQRTSKR